MIEEEFQETKSIVLRLLQEDERCRNNDKYLMWRIIKYYSPDSNIPYSVFAKVPSFETIVRSRRIIQNDIMLYRPTDPEVIKKRRDREKSIKKYVRLSRAW